jgi:hypothetical protein
VVALFGDQHFDIDVSAERRTVVVSTQSRFAAAAIAFVLVMTNPVASLFFVSLAAEASFPKPSAAIATA